MVLADKFSVGAAVAGLRFCYQRCFGFRLGNCHLLFLSFYSHILNEGFMVFIRFLETKNKISSQVGGYAHPVVNVQHNIALCIGA
jgi:hypothetical protein